MGAQVEAEALGELRLVVAHVIVGDARETMLAQAAVMPYALERRTWCGSMISPGSTSSLPVEITTIMGWALTRRRAMPAPAAIATSGGPRARAGRQQQRALAAVRAAAMHVLPRLHGLASDLRELAVALHLLDRHHRIATARQHRARHDLDAARRIRPESAADRPPPGARRCAAGRMFSAAAAVLSAMPSMATRSKGGWSRSA